MDNVNNSFFPYREDGSAEILLAHVLNVTRTWLHTYPEKIKLSRAQQKQFDQLINRRAQGEPIAYLTGKQEFWSLPLKVNSYTLIPRPETELLVELALALFPSTSLLSKEDFVLADLGTGSGAIAIALAHERPNWKIFATDNDPNTLAVAKHNAAHTKIYFSLGDWCRALPSNTQCDIILSNPPYISEEDPHLQGDGVRYEPLAALISGPDGLKDIRNIIQLSQEYLKPHGWLLLEHGYNQAEHISNLFRLSDYHHIKTYQDLSGLDRVTMGQL